MMIEPLLLLGAFLTVAWSSGWWVAPGMKPGRHDERWWMVMSAPIRASPYSSAVAPG
jgi:hypothetical protein